MVDVQASAHSMSWTCLLCLVLLLLLGCGDDQEASSPGPPKGAPGQGRNVLLITVDTLRADHLGLYGYARPTSPRVDEWFADAAIFERGYATEANTSPSVVSILTGKFPFEHRLRLLYQLLPQDLRLLPDLLPDAYQSAAFVSNPVLTDEAMGIASHFDHYDDFVSEKIQSIWPRFERNAEETTDAVLAWLASDRAPERPLFLWVHFIDPHMPYDPPPSWTRTFTHEGSLPLDPERLPIPAAPSSGLDALDLIDLYDEEIAYVDSQIGRLLDGYAGLADVDETLIIFTSDHGESMTEHEYWFVHGYHVYEEIARVPFMIRGPGIEPGRRPGVTSGVDVAPTVLAFVGAAEPADISGLDLRAPPMPGDGRIV
jgi:arylsulfatase